MVEGSKYDFPVISGDDRQVAGPSLDEAEFGDVTTHGETLFEYVGGDWKKGVRGEPVGTLTLVHSPTMVKGRVFVRAIFVFDDGDTVEYGGLVPGNGSWKGKGRFGYRGGTGKFAEPRGEIQVESTNPKLWG